MFIIDILGWVATIFTGTHLNWTFDGSVLNTIAGVVDFIAWVIPIDTIYICAQLSFSLLVFRVIVSFFHSLWNLLPVL